jgi:glycosyltransferase involved in cell wall biosynthesis
MPKVSVILPIYNAGSYLEPCLESIRVQTLEDIEVLCVNDGSKDDSLATMQKFADKDARFKVLDKPNGGYGHSLNYGLAHATGEYIAIVEPDDFIDPHMYDDLYAFAHQGGRADIVKGSYWEFFDGRNGVSNEVREPNLSKYMPKTPKVFTLQESSDVFCYHPSIWSAIYSREFLDRNKIRFVEPKGAGWADNPFFAETLVCAERIVWVPNNYYFYRQTNAAASSFLKDFHIPFDRTREMRSILAKHHASEDVWAALYLREFDYIFSVIGEFGFNESNPEIRALIQEVLDSMDSAIVHSNTRLRPKDIQYYDDFLNNKLGTAQLVGGVFSPKRSTSCRPLVSYVVPVRNQGKWIEQSIRSLAAVQKCEYEVIFVNCGSTDRSMFICHNLAQGDGHFVCLEDDFQSVRRGVGAAIREACGAFVYIWDLSTAVDGRFGKAVDALKNTEADILMIDRSFRFTVEMMRHQGMVELDSSPFLRTPNEVDSFISRPVPPSEIANFVFNCSTPSMCGIFYRRTLIESRENEGRDADDPGHDYFAVQTIADSRSVQYAAMNCFQNLNRDEAVMPFFLDLHDEFIKVSPLLTPSALFTTRNLSPDIINRYIVSLHNLVLDSFVWDLEHCPSYELMVACYRSYFNDVDAFLGGVLTEQSAHDDVAFNRYQLLRNFGLDAFICDLFLQGDIDNSWLRNDINNLRNSPTMRIGRKVNQLARSVVPESVLGALKSKMDVRGK